MMKIIEEFILKARKYSTAWGKVWWLLNVLFRGFVVQSVGAASFADETFICDTQQPGCTKVCHNRFMPMGPIRFWNMQLVFLFLPTIFFYTYATKFTERVKTLERMEKEEGSLQAQEAKEQESMSRYSDSETATTYIGSTMSQTSRALHRKRQQVRDLRRKLGKFKKKQKHDSIAGEQTEQVMGTKMKVMYVIHVLVKILVEIVFLWGNYMLQLQQSQNYNYGFAIWSKAWTVPEKYICQTTEQYAKLVNADNFYGKLFFSKNEACSQNSYGIPCWVGKPNEKTFFLKYMILCDYVSITVCILEIVEIAFKTTKKKVTRKLEESREIDFSDSASQLGGHQSSHRASPRHSYHGGKRHTIHSTGPNFESGAITKTGHQKVAHTSSHAKKGAEVFESGDGYYIGAGMRTGSGSYHGGRHDTTHHTSNRYNPHDIHKMLPHRQPSPTLSHISEMSRSRKELARTQDNTIQIGSERNNNEYGKSSDSD